jgi:hypothetical protein
VLLSVAGLLLAVAAYSWWSYIAQGISYGAIVGLPGREHDLVLFGSRAMKALRIAVSSEALAIATISWGFTARKPVWARLCIAAGLAIAANICTFAAVRGL